MALTPTIFKFKISVSDFNHDYYDTLQLTVAQHPSETLERMMARLLAFCLHAHDDKEKLMVFSKGLSSPDEPDIWKKSLDDRSLLWVEVGEPSFDRLKKSCRLSSKTCVYTFNSKSDVWWKQSQSDLSSLPVEVHQFSWDEIQQFSKSVKRTMELSITLSDNTLFVALENEQLELHWQTLQ
jgi:uncharacterized protein YaeQ